MNAEEIVKIIREEYGIHNMKELDRAIRELQALNISAFCTKKTEENTK